MKSLWTTERKIVAGFVTAVVVICAVAGVAIWTTAALLRALDAAHKITIVDNDIGSLSNNASSMIPAIRGFMVSRSDALFSDWETYAAKVAMGRRSLKQ